MMIPIRSSFFLAIAVLLFGSANAKVPISFGPDEGPVIISSSPTDDATQVEVESDLTITFSVPVQKGAGDIIIKKYSDNAILETIDVNGEYVSIADATVTIDPDKDLEPGTHYYVQIDQGAFTSLAEGDFGGIPDNITWSFTTFGAPEAPTELTLNEISSTEVSLTWEDKSDNETGFTVLRSSATDFSRDSVLTSLSENVTTFNDNTLSAEETYYYQVSAVNSEFSVPSNVVANVDCAPDLTVDEKIVYADFYTVLPGDQIMLTGTIINQGDCTPNFAAQPTYKVFLSEDYSLSGSDINLAEVNLMDLKEGEKVALQSITIPNDTSLVGDYYLIIQIDPDQLVYESNESNNTYRVAITISNQIDIKIENLVVDSSSYNEIYLTYDVVNLSNGPVGSFNVSYQPYEELSVRHLDGLLKGDTITVNESIFIPCEEGHGTYVKANINSDESFIEINESNNRDSVEFEYNYNPSFNTDFVIRKLKTNVNTINVGESLTVSSSATNGGRNVAYFLSMDQYLDATDIELGISDNIPSEIPCLRMSSDISKELTIPVETSLGNYYVLAKIDYNDDVEEIDEGNNVASVELLVSDDPDLIVSNVVVTNTPENMGILSLTFDVTNQGKGPVGQSRINAYLSDDNNPDNAKIIARDSSVLIPELASGETYNGSASFTLTSCGAVLDKYVFLKADYSGLISEEYEDNNLNINGVFVAIGDVPDFEITHISADDTTNDNTILADFTIRNNSGTLKASSVKFYLSNDVNLGASDIELKTINISGLACSDSIEYVGEAFTLPTDLNEGKYIIIAAIDEEGEITEINEQNNRDFFIFNKGGSPLDPEPEEEDPGDEDPDGEEPLPVCEAPTGLSVGTISENSVTLMWDDMGASDYQLWISGIGTVYTTGGENSYPLDGLASGATYTWMVKSKCMQTGKISFSNNSSGKFKTSGESVCAQSPENLTVGNNGTNSVILEWDDMGASDYQLWISGIGTIYTTGGENSYPLDGLASGATYTWMVKSKCTQTGKTSFSNNSSGEFKTSGESVCAQSPKNLTVSNIGTNSVILEWDDMGASDYQLWISGIGTVYTTGGENSYPLDGLASGAIYTWMVKSKCAQTGGASFSDNSSGEFTTSGESVCTQSPENLTVSNIGTNSVILEWDDVGASDYQLWISGIGTVYTTGGENSYPLDGLASGAIYTWMVKSKCTQNGKTSFSNNSSGEFKTSGESVCAQSPENLTVSNIGTNSVILEWDDMGASDYQLWISGIGTIYTTGGENSYPLDGLIAGATYTWGVKSKCQDTGRTVFSGSTYNAFTVPLVIDNEEKRLVTDNEQNRLLVEPENQLYEPLGNDKDQEILVSLYPNPSIDEVNIVTTGGDIITSVTVLNFQGDVVKKINNLNSTYETIYFREVGVGIYFINVIFNGHQKVTKRVLIQ